MECLPRPNCPPPPPPPTTTTQFFVCSFSCIPADHSFIWVVRFIGRTDSYFFCIICTLHCSDPWCYKWYTNYFLFYTSYTVGSLLSEHQQGVIPIFTSQNNDIHRCIQIVFFYFSEHFSCPNALWSQHVRISDFRLYHVWCTENLVHQLT